MVSKVKGKEVSHKADLKIEIRQTCMMQSHMKQEIMASEQSMTRAITQAATVLPKQ